MAAPRTGPHGQARSSLLLIGVLLWAGLGACSDSADRTPALPRPIAWTVVEPVDHEITRTLSGVVRAIQRAPISFEVGGRVASVTVDIGDHFEAGDTLATLDRRTYRLTMEERESELAEARARLVEARNEYERQKELHAKGWVARAGYDTALAGLETAQSRVEIARTRAAIAAEDLEDTVLTAPYAGSVAERLAEPSQQVSPGETVFEIQGDSSGLEVVVTAPETMIDQLAPGSRHTVFLPAHRGMMLSATITEVATNASVRNAFPVTLRLDDAPETLRSGVTAEVMLSFNTDGSQTPTDRLVSIPVTGFLAASGQTSVAFVYDKVEGTVSRRDITVADISGDRALISQGLSVGEIIAMKGLPFLQDGQKVARLDTGIARYNP